MHVFMCMIILSTYICWQVGMSMESLQLRNGLWCTSALMVDRVGGQLMHIVQTYVVVRVDMRSDCNSHAEEQEAGAVRQCSRVEVAPHSMSRVCCTVVGALLRADASRAVHTHWHCIFDWEHTMVPHPINEMKNSGRVGWTYIRYLYICFV